VNDGDCLHVGNRTGHLRCSQIVGHGLYFVQFRSGL